MKVMKQPTELNSIGLLLETARTSGFRTLVLGDAEPVCCAARSGGRDLELLVEQHALASYSQLLVASGFCSIGMGKGAHTDHAFRFLGYCEHCCKLVQLNVSTVLNLSSVHGTSVLVKSAPAIFNATEKLSVVQKEKVLDIITCVCSAATVPEYRFRLKQCLLARARSLAECCAPCVIQLVAGAMLGNEAGRYIVKLLEGLESWETDLLLSELKRLLIEAEQVEVTRNFHVPFFGKHKQQRAQRLTDSAANHRRAPVVLITDTELQYSYASRLKELFGAKLDCRLEHYATLDNNGHRAVSHKVDGKGLATRLSFAVSALKLALENYGQYRRVHALARGGVLVVVPGYPPYCKDKTAPLLNHWLDSGHLLWVLAAKIERYVYRKISNGVVDSHLIIEASRTVASLDVKNVFNEKRLNLQLSNLPVASRYKAKIPRGLSQSEALSRMVIQTLKVIATP